jgi:hypothetical protein
VLAGSPAEQVHGGSHLSKNLIHCKRVSRTRLNVLDSYAVDDHRWMADQEKKACI